MNILNILNNKELSEIPILYIVIYDLWFRRKGNIQKASWNTSKYNTSKYHLMYKGDLCPLYFYAIYIKTLAFFSFMYYNINILKKKEWYIWKITMFIQKWQMKQQIE